MRNNMFYIKYSTKRLLGVIVVLFMMPYYASAQLAIESTGRAVVGNTPFSLDDPDHMLTMTIQGSHVLGNAGAKLGFGDFGRYCLNGWNVFVGEFGSSDTDILWLHGKKGLKMTSQKSNYLIADWNYPNNGLPRFSFYTGVRADKLVISSDDNHKSSIITIPMALPRLILLNGVQYNYTPLNNTISVGDTGQCPTRTSGSLTEKEAEDSAYMASLLNTRDQGDFRYGLLTSNLTNYFPDVVETDATGNQYVNYIEMIPVIIAAIKELYVSLSNTLEANGISLNVMEEYEAYLRNSNPADGMMYAIGDGHSAHTTTEAYLCQNTPNPFNSATQINYFIPANATSAEIYVFTLNGEMLHSYPISTFSNGSVTISGSTLYAGMYIYSLVVDGKVVDTKRMILTR